VIELIKYFLKLGAIGFGGPIALIGYMQRDLVDKRGWFPQKQFNEGLALSNLCPGPLASQLAMYLGWLRKGVLGATLVGIAFNLPAFIMVCILAVLYHRFESYSGLSAIFYATSAAVLGLIWKSSFKLFQKVVGRDWFLGIFFIVSATSTAFFHVEAVLIFIGSGLIAALVRTSPWSGTKGIKAALMLLLLNLILFADRLQAQIPVPNSVAQVSAELEKQNTLWLIFSYFFKVGALVFGSGMVIVPFLYTGVVQQFHWLTQAQFLDAVAVGLVTPGPAVITVVFIGFLVKGLAGAVVAAIGIFLPAYLCVLILAPLYRKFSHNLAIKEFILGVTAAATGAIAGAAFDLSRKTLLDVRRMAIFAVVVLVLWRFKRFPEPLVIVAAGLLGPVIAHL